MYGIYLKNESFHILYIYISCITFYNIKNSLKISNKVLFSSGKAVWTLWDEIVYTILIFKYLIGWKFDFQLQKMVCVLPCAYNGTEILHECSTVIFAGNGILMIFKKIIIYSCYKIITKFWRFQTNIYTL